MSRIETTEEWRAQSPKMGDHIRVDLGLFTHHGIYISHDEVIHFTRDCVNNNGNSEPQIVVTDLDTFLEGGTLEVKIYTEEEVHDLYPVEDIAAPKSLLKRLRKVDASGLFAGR